MLLSRVFRPLTSGCDFTHWKYAMINSRSRSVNEMGDMVESSRWCLNVGVGLREREGCFVWCVRVGAGCVQVMLELVEDRKAGVGCKFHRVTLLLRRRRQPPRTRLKRKARNTATSVSSPWAQHRTKWLHSTVLRSPLSAFFAGTPGITACHCLSHFPYLSQ